MAIARQENIEFAGSQCEHTGYAIDGIDLPERGAAMDKRLIVDNVADDARVRPPSRHQSWNKMTTHQALTVKHN